MTDTNNHPDVADHGKGIILAYGGGGHALSVAEAVTDPNFFAGYTALSPSPLMEPGMAWRRLRRGGSRR